VAYKVYKELERILKSGDINLSVDKVLDIAKTITTLKIRLPISNETIARTMLITAKHKSIAKLFDDFFLEICLGVALSKSGDKPSKFIEFEGFVYLLSGFVRVFQRKRGFYQL
ncbi:hypothetical protein EZS27_031374, partial [termite gut metagenome]